MRAWRMVNIPIVELRTKGKQLHVMLHELWVSKYKNY